MVDISLPTNRVTLPWHYVATGYVLSPDQRHMLMVLHRKLGKWLPPGGHVEQGELPHQCALREVFEETGVQAAHIDSLTLDLVAPEKQIPAPLAMLDELIPANAKEAAHRHIDFIFLMTAPQGPLVKLASNEVTRAGWMTLAQIENIQTFPAVRQIAARTMNV